MKKIFFFIVLSSFSSYSQTHEDGTNPLAPILEAPISDVKQPQKIEKSPEIEVPITNSVDTAYELTENAKRYLHEKENPNPLSEFEDNRPKFVDYNTPPPAVYNNTNEEAGYWFLGGICFTILVTMSIVILKNRKG